MKTRNKTNKYFYLLTYDLLLLIFLGYFFKSPYLFIGIFFGYTVILAIFDAVFRHFNVGKAPLLSVEEVAVMDKNDGTDKLDFYTFVTKFYLVFYIIALFTGVYFAQFESPTLGWILYAIPFSVVTGFMLSISHEYFHSKNKINHIISRVISSLCFWNVHEYEHLVAHHNLDFICTDFDRSHAKLNQSVYSFLIGSIVSNYENAWKFQKNISERNKKWFYNIFSNTLLQGFFFSLIVMLIIFLFIGTNGLMFFLLQGILGTTSHIIVSYNQHYGLTRRKNSDGTYEPFTIMNVWNCSDANTRKNAFNVSLHAHHHLYQFCQYQNLKCIDKNPILPFGYYASLYFSLIPPLWFKIMNKHVKEVFRLRDQYEKDGVRLR